VTTTVVEGKEIITGAVRYIQMTAPTAAQVRAGIAFIVEGTTKDRACRSSV